MQPDAIKVKQTHEMLVGSIGSKNEEELYHIVENFSDAYGREATLELLLTFTVHHENQELELHLPHVALFLSMPRLLDQSIAYGYSAADAFFKKIKPNDSVIVGMALFNENPRMMLHLIENYLDTLVELPEFKLNSLIHLVDELLIHQHPRNIRIYSQISDILKEKRKSIYDELTTNLFGDKEPSAEKWSYWLKFLGEYSFKNAMQTSEGTAISAIERKNYLQKSPIVFQIVAKNWIKSLQFLIDQNVVTLDEKTICEAVPFLRDQTLLMTACEHNHKEMVEYLLSKTSSLSLRAIDGENQNVLFYIKSPLIFDMVNAKASLLFCQFALMYQRSLSFNNNFMESYIYHGRSDLVLYLLTPPSNIPHVYDARSLLSAARVMYWDEPHNQQLWEVFGQQIKKLFPSETRAQAEPIVIEPKKHEIQGMINSAYLSLFGTLQPEQISSKEKALEYCYAQIKTYFGSQSEACIPYLSLLSKEFEAYYRFKHKTDFPILQREQIEFKPIDFYYYPIPKNVDYQGIKKHSALQEYLIGLFQQHGFGQQAAKWIGFLPKKQAEDWIFEANFFVEETLGEGLTHGKIIHMLHWAVILLMCIDERLAVNYDENGQAQKLTAKDIITHLVKKHTKDNTLAWNQLIDSGSPNEFSLPNSLNSFIMQQGTQNGMRALSDYLTDTFCKGFLKLHRTHNVHLKSNKDLDSFYDIMNDRKILGFGIYKPLIPYAKHKEEAKGNIATTAPFMSHYIVKRNYDVNKEFNFENVSHETKKLKSSL